MEPSSRGDKYCQCPRCGTRDTRSGIVRDFYLGSEAASAVLSSALFEKMPEPKWDGKKQPRPVKQFLMFSDSRKSASYAAVNLGDSHSNILMHRNLYELIVNRHSREFEKGVGVGRVREMLEIITSGQFIDNDEETNTEASKLSNRMILMELVNGRSNKSLENLGLFRFEYRGHGINIPGLKPDECDSFVSTVVKLFRDRGAIQQEYTIGDSDHTYARLKGLFWVKRYGESGEPAFILEPSTKGSNSVYRYISKIVGDSNYKQVQAELGRMRCFEDTRDGKVLNPDKLTMVRSKTIFKCNSCGKISAHSVHKVCPYCLEEELSIIESPIYTSNNHYAKKYREMPLERLVVKEHTAQLIKEDASKYQEQFLNQKINVLSCSTTFEMGVDIGDLQYVFMRNVPPSPSNYAQRAGRAGRGADVSAFILTFCKTTPHDSTFFKDP